MKKRKYYFGKNKLRSHGDLTRIPQYLHGAVFEYHLGDCPQQCIQVKEMRKTNNELEALPGFFFYPFKKEGLVELSLYERLEVFSNQGNYNALLTYSPSLSEAQKTDLICILDNSRIPTHKKPDAIVPDYGDVPFDLRVIRRV